MNVALTNRCPRRCSFCYQADVMDEATRTRQLEMPVENFAAVLEFIKRSGEHKLTLAGGEPTTHRQIETILAMVGDDPDIHQAVLFTNALFKPKLVPILARYRRKLMVSINVLHPDEESADNLRTLERNLGLLTESEVPFDLSFVISHADFDAGFLFDYIERFPVQGLRWSLSFPVAENAAFVPASELPRTGSRVVKMVEELSARGIRSYVDCPLPYCLFTDEEMGVISREALSVVNWGYCGLTLEVNPDLGVKACPAQAEAERIKLSSFSDMKQMERYFYARMSRYKARHKLYDECDDCRYWQQRRCQGGCLGYSRELTTGLDPAAPLPANATLPSGLRIETLPNLELVAADTGATTLRSAVSTQVEPEPVSDKEAALWRRMGERPRIGDLVESVESPGREVVENFLLRLARIGFVSLVDDHGAP